jgi:hypothetical protein
MLTSINLNCGLLIFRSIDNVKNKIQDAAGVGAIGTGKLSDTIDNVKNKIQDSDRAKTEVLA